MEGRKKSISTSASISNRDVIKHLGKRLITSRFEVEIEVEVDLGLNKFFLTGSIGPYFPLEVGLNPLLYVKYLI